jgi:hypothetical protein
VKKNVALLIIAEYVMKIIINAKFVMMATIYLLMPIKNLYAKHVLLVVQNVMLQVSKYIALLAIIIIYQDIMTKMKWFLATQIVLNTIVAENVTQKEMNAQIALMVIMFPLIL